ncbi:MAG: hypothetical protein ABI665_17120 [Vicinamibacterales bacterium]
MADPLSSGPRPASAHHGAEDDARIEHLLVTGLDHYFAGEFEPAINLWTRVLFLDRNHDRARAYIDRARSAQAEQQRASEALVHQGLEAFDRGEVGRARALLSDALDQGASHDLALGVLGRIDRLDVGQQASATAPAKPDTRRRALARYPEAPANDAARRSLASAWTFLILTIVVAAGLLAWTAPDLSLWWPASREAARPIAVSAVLAPLPVPAPTEVYVTRARALFANGKLRDALSALDRVPQGDSLRQDADRLRGEIQQQLLLSASPPRE